MLRSISVRQFAAWRAYSDLEPWDESRDDWRAASIVRAVMNANRKRGAAPLKLADCRLVFGAEAEKDKPKTKAEAGAQVRQAMGFLVEMQQAARASKARRRAAAPPADGPGSAKLVKGPARGHRKGGR